MVCCVETQFLRSVCRSEEGEHVGSRVPGVARAVLNEEGRTRRLWHPVDRVDGGDLLDVCLELLLAELRTRESHEPGVMDAPRLERKRADPVLHACQHRGHGSPVAKAGCGDALAIHLR